MGEKILCNGRVYGWQYNTAHALCMLDTSDYTHTLRIYYLLLVPLQQWLHQRALILGYLFIATLVTC
jgi:hypothetical protein